MPSTTIDNRADLIDSRDIIERIESLETARDIDPAQWERDNPEDAAELAALESLQREAREYAEDWQYGVALIRDSYFTEHVEELLKDCGDLPHDLPWYVVIDWDATARHVQQDYTEVEFDGVTYWVR